MSTFNLKVISPDKEFFHDDVEMAVVKTIEGDVGLMADHVNYVSPLDIGVIKIKKDGKFKEAALAGGFIKFFNNKATIITEAAEWPEEIDLDRAKKAKERALANDDKESKKEAQKAENRIKIANKK